MHIKGISRKTKLSLAIATALTGFGFAQVAHSAAGGCADVDFDGICTGADAAITSPFPNLAAAAVFGANTPGGGPTTFVGIAADSITGNTTLLANGTLGGGIILTDGVGTLSYSAATGLTDGTVTLLGGSLTGTIFLTDGAASLTGGSLTGTTFLTDGAASLTGGSLTGTTFLTDGVASLTGGSLTGLVSWSAGLITGGTITDGMGATMTGGAVTALSVTGGTVTDGMGATMTGGKLTAISGVSDGTATLLGGSLTGTTFLTDGVVSLTGGSLTDGANTLAFGGTTSGVSLTSANTVTGGMSTLTQTSSMASLMVTDVTGTTTKGLLIEDIGGTEIHTRLEGGIATSFIDLTDTLTHLGNASTTSGGMVLIDATGPAGEVNIYANDAATPTLGGVELRDAEASIGSEDTGTGGAGYFLATPASAMVAVDHGIGGTVTDGLFVDPSGTTLTGGSVFLEATGPGGPGGGAVYANSSDPGTGELTLQNDMSTLSGGFGADRTTLTLDNAGAHLDNHLDMGGNQINNLAPGFLPTDAINKSQLDKAIDDLEEETSGGIASIAAMAAIPGPVPGKRFSIGLGAGFYNSENAIAAGFNARVSNSLSISGAVGGGSNGETAGSVGASISW